MRQDRGWSVGRIIGVSGLARDSTAPPLSRSVPSSPQDAILASAPDRPGLRQSPRWCRSLGPHPLTPLPSPPRQPGEGEPPNPLFFIALGGGAPSPGGR